MDAKHGIGINEKMPWSIKEEMQLFTQTTKGHSLLFGRKTFDGIGRLLKNRKHYVVTHNSSYHKEGVEIIDDLDLFLKKNQASEEVIFISGGASIYKQAFPYIKEAYISILNTSYPCDTFFPEMNWDDFECDYSQTFETFTHYHYRRIK